MRRMRSTNELGCERVLHRPMDSIDGPSVNDMVSLGIKARKKITKMKERQPRTALAKALRLTNIVS